MLSVHTSPLAMLGGKKTGGMNVYVRDFSRELSREGIQVDVFTRSQDASAPFIEELGVNGRVINILAGPRQPIATAEVPQHLNEFTQGVLAFATAENIQYDVIHSHYWLSGLVAEQLRDVWGTPIVQIFHTLGHMKNKIAMSDSERAPQVRLDGECRVIQTADRIIAATLAEEEQLVSLYNANPGKISIIPPGVDLERFHPIDKKTAKKRVGIPCGDTNILFAGRIEPLKGIDTMLRAMALIQKRRPDAVENCCMAIIGGDPWADDLDEEMARLQELRHDLDIHDLVMFLGAKDQEILPNYYAAAEMVVMPSHYESFGMVALEAMAMGTPVIASEVGGLAHLVQHGVTGYHVPSRNPEALAGRIFELLSNPECRDYMGRNARQHARQYAWPNITAKFMKVYGAVLRGQTCVML